MDINLCGEILTGSYLIRMNLKKLLPVNSS